MKFNIIIITDSQYGISKYNKMAWYSSDDLKHFNNITLNNICIMGSNTAKNLGQPLKDRDCIVITSKENELHLDFIIVKNFEDALKKAKELIRPNAETEIFVIGGKQLYDEALKSDKLDKIYFTHINKSYDCHQFVEPILGRDDMNYKIINKIDVENISLPNTIDIKYNVELTFYLINKK